MKKKEIEVYNKAINDALDCLGECANGTYDDRPMQDLKYNEDSEREFVVVSTWQFKRILNTLNMLNRSFNMSTKESCLFREVIKSIDWMNIILNK